MNQTSRKMPWVVLGLMVASFSPVMTHAQAETGAQDHPSSNTAAVAPVNAKMEFQGHFTLPFDMQCHGHKLVAGDYTLLVKTVGEDKMVTVQRAGSDVVLQSRPVPPTSAPNEGHSAVLVRHGPGPGAHTLEGVYVESLKLVLFLDETGHTKALDKMFASVMRVPIT